MAATAFRRIIQHAVWRYLRFTLSSRDTEELLAEWLARQSRYEAPPRWML
jgi:transposase-like protein